MTHIVSPFGPFYEKRALALLMQIRSDVLANGITYIKTAGPLTSKMEKMAAALPRNNNSHIYNIKKNSPRPKHHFIHSQDDMVEIFFGFCSHVSTGMMA